MFKFLKVGLFTGIVAGLIAGCSHTTTVTPPKQSATHKSHSHTHTHTTKTFDGSMNKMGKIVQLPTAQEKTLPVKDVPASFVMWLSQGDNQQRVREYHEFLTKNQVANIVPMFELLRTARSWEKCGSSQYAVPNRELWNNSISTLKVFNYLISMNILNNFEVTSVYRDLPLNQCAGGAGSSKHLFNAAIDFRLGSAQPQQHELASIEQTKAKLCHFWAQHGASLGMGLGVYRSGQIHIDTQGFRTWGPELNKESSPCYYLISYS